MPNSSNTLKLKLVGKNWWIDGYINGARIRQSTGRAKEQEDKAKLELAKLIAEKESKKERVEKKEATFNEVALNFISMSKNKSVGQQAGYIEDLTPYIGDIRMSSLGARPYPRADLDGEQHVINQFIWDQAKGLTRNEEGKTMRREKVFRNGKHLTALYKKGMTVSTINKKIQFLNSVATAGIERHQMMDSSGWTKIREVDENEVEYFGFNPEGFKLAFEPEWLHTLMSFLPKYLADMALFSVHTGQRDAVVCNLKWDWLKQEDNYYFFQVPYKRMKSAKKLKKDKQKYEYVILNDRARDLVLSLRGNGSENVFVKDDGSAVEKQMVTSWLTARKKTEEKFPEMVDDEDGSHLVDVHSFKRTFVNALDNEGVEETVAHKLSNHAIQGVHDKYKNMTPKKRKWLYNCVQQINDAYNVGPKVRLHYDSDLGRKKSCGNASG